MQIRALTIALALFALPAAVTAATLFVAPTGADSNDCLTAPTACLTIRRAITISAAGDTVQIAAGVYPEFLVIGKNLTLDGEVGTVVDGAGSGRVVSVTAGTVTLRDLTIQNGFAASTGGGLSATGGTVTIVNCTLAGNRANLSGGGLQVATATVTVVNSLFTNNRGGDGGGIYVASGSLAVTNSTLEGNIADGNGGGLFVSAGVTSLNSSTVTGNRAGVDGGGLHDGGPGLTMRNTILWANSAGGFGQECRGSVTSSGYNLVGDRAGCTLALAATDQVDVDPLLGSLADNGGPTATRALAAGSPAIDAGDPAGCRDGGGGLLGRDQRGQNRMADCSGVGPRCDVGAYEHLACAVIDVMSPLETRGLRLVRRGDDVEATWDPVTTDIAGGVETIDHYRIYRDPSRDVDPEIAVNLRGTATAAGWSDLGAVADGATHYYQVTAVDRAGNERRTEAPRVTTPPVLSGAPGAGTIDLSWTAAQPVGEVVGYRVYWGSVAGGYDRVDDVGLATTHALSGVIANVTYNAAVTALDAAGNESDLSNVHADGLTASTVDVAVLDQAHLCFDGRGACPPRRHEIQKDAGREILVPVTLPTGGWGKVELTLTLNSYATIASHCASPGCVWPNPTGDIYDRLLTVYLVEDETCVTGGSCWGNPSNLELLHAVTPFGTDGFVGERVYTFDVTPFAPLLAGRKYIGINVNTWDGAGWWADVDLYFSELPGEASPKPPAAGFAMIHYENDNPASTARSVSIPATATDVKMRLFVSGHGSATNAACPGAPADEFCPRTTQVTVDGSPVWTDSPWRTDCNSAFGACPSFNACGCSSCVYDRSAWCPGMITCHDNEPCDQDLAALGWLPPGETHDVQFQITNPTAGSWWSYSLVVYWY